MIAKATDFKIHLGTYLIEALKEPVIVEKNGRNMAVLLSMEEYERLSMLEDKYWEGRAEAAEKEGFLGPEESMKAIREGVCVDA